jgi:serine/threonine-protein kinase
MASVYEVRHRNGRKAALKVLHPELASDATSRRRFLTEAYAANKVEHPGVPLVEDDGEDGDLAFLVMELLTGKPLSDRLAQGAFSVSETVRVSAAVLDVLASAHDHGVIHRDIKPSNIFELATGQIKVLDFGVALIVDAGLVTLTSSGVAVGTPAYMAPEQASGRREEVDALSDIWAVGATMFTLLARRHVHDAKGYHASLVAAATKPAPLIGTVLPALPADVAAVIDRALAFDRNERWPNARAMQSALLRCVPGTALPSSMSIESAPTLPESRKVAARPRTTWLRAGLAIGVFGLVAGGVKVTIGLREGRAVPVSVAPSPIRPAVPPPVRPAPAAPAVVPIPAPPEDKAAEPVVAETAADSPAVETADVPKPPAGLPRKKRPTDDDLLRGPRKGRGH